VLESRISAPQASRGRLRDSTGSRSRPTGQFGAPEPPDRRLSAPEALLATSPGRRHGRVSEFSPFSDMSSMSSAYRPLMTRRRQSHLGDACGILHQSLTSALRLGRSTGSSGVDARWLLSAHAWAGLLISDENCPQRPLMPVNLMIWLSVFSVSDLTSQVAAEGWRARGVGRLPRAQPG
jgi:hypothetical protein